MPISNLNLKLPKKDLLIMTRLMRVASAAFLWVIPNDPCLYMFMLSAKTNTL